MSVTGGIYYQRDSSNRIVTATPQSLTSQTGFGASPLALASNQVSAGPTNLIYARIVFIRDAVVYFQWHNKLNATAFSNATQHSIGYLLSPANSNLLIEIPMHFSIGCAWAISSTQTSYTASAETVLAEIQYVLV